MDELSLQLKESVVESLLRNDQNLNEPYLVANNKTYNRRELAEEISHETEFGVKLLSNMMYLSLGLMARGKK